MQGADVLGAHQRLAAVMRATHHPGVGQLVDGKEIHLAADISSRSMSGRLQYSHRKLQRFPDGGVTMSGASGFSGRARQRTGRKRPALQ
jgi:transcriptional regulator GlxA family with amidase domain